MNVLLVHNTKKTKLIIGQLLIQKGHDVTFTDNLEIAGQKYQEKFYPLVLLELDSHNEQILKLSIQMRSNSQSNATMFLIIVSHGNFSEIQVFLNAGIDDYILKPLQLDELVLRFQVIEKKIRYYSPIQQLLNDMLSPNHTLSDSFYQKILENQHFYLILNHNLEIIEISANAEKLAYNTDSMIKGHDVRESFPELIGLEDKFEQIITGQENNISLPSIYRQIDEEHEFYFDLSISKYLENTSNNSEGSLILLFNNSTSKMLLEQQLSQKVNESQLLLKEIATKQEYINKIINNIADALIVTDERGIIQQVNPATINLFGYTEIELNKQSISMIIKDNVIKLSSDTNFHEREFICQKKDYKELIISFSCNSIYQDEELLFIFIGRDITERQKAVKKIKELNENLEITNRELEAFSYTVSHDLKNPLNNLKIFNFLLLEEYGSVLDDNGKDYLKEMDNCCERMNQLINDLLKLSMVKNKSIEPIPVNISKLVFEIIDSFKVTSPHQKTDIIIQPDVIVKADLQLIKIALENLLGNAWKYSKKKNLIKIEFGVINNDDKLIYFIKDNGAGFDNKYIDRLFKPFERCHSYDEFEGTGIGLTTVERIIQIHEGKIWAESVINEGATFYFTLGSNKIYLGLAD